MKKITLSILLIFSFSLSFCQKVVEEVNSISFLKSEYNNSNLFAEVSLILFKEYEFPDSLNSKYIFSISTFESKKEEVGSSFGVGVSSAGQRIGIGISMNKVYENSKVNGVCDVPQQDISKIYKIFNDVLVVSGELKFNTKSNNTIYLSDTYKNVMIGCEIKKGNTSYFFTVDNVTFKFENKEFFEVAKFLFKYKNF